MFPRQLFLPLEVPLLKGPEGAIGNKCKAERKLKSNITTELRVANLLADGSNEPHLSHTHDSAEDAEAESCNSGDTWWELGGLIVDFGCVASETTLEDEVLGERDTFVNGKPIPLRNGLVIGMTGVWAGELTINNMKFSRADSKLE